jgi:hypothetical protein
MVEGVYVVQAFVKDGDDAADEWEDASHVIGGTSGPVTVRARATTDGVLTVSGLGWVNDRTGAFVDNPTVALYSAPACHHPHSAVTVEYAEEASVLTWRDAQSTVVDCDNASANIWVTGLKPDTNYLMRHRINGGDPSCMSIDDCPQTGKRSLPTDPSPLFPNWSWYQNLDGTSLYYAPYDMTVHLFVGAISAASIGPAAVQPLAIDKYGTCLDATMAFPCTPTPRWYYWPQNDMEEFKPSVGVFRILPATNKSSSPATFLSATKRVEDSDTNRGGNTEEREIDLAGNPVFEINVRVLQHRLEVAYGCVGPCQWNAGDVPAVPILDFHRDVDRFPDRYVMLAGTRKCLPNVGNPNTDGEPDGRSGSGGGTALVGPWWNCSVATQLDSTDPLGTGTADGKWWSGELIIAVDSEGRFDGGRGWVWNSFDQLDPHDSRPDARLAVCLDDADKCTTGPQCVPQYGCYRDPYGCVASAGTGHVGGDCTVRGMREYLHANAFSLDTDGNIVISLRRQNKAVKLRYTSGEGDGSLIWALGAGGDFCTREPGTNTCRTYSSQDPLGTVVPWSQWPNPSNFFSMPHTTYFSNDGDFLVYDNGRVRCDQEPGAGGDVYLCGAPPDDNPAGFQGSRGQAWSLTFNKDGSPKSADPLLNFILGPRPDDPTRWIYTESVGSAQKLPGTGRDGLPGSQNYVFVAGTVKIALYPSVATVAYLIEVARDMNGTPVNAYRSKLQAIDPTKQLLTYRGYSTGSIADGTP